MACQRRVYWVVLGIGKKLIGRSIGTVRVGGMSEIEELSISRRNFLRAARALGVSGML
jgi:hypothetical protein